MLELGTMTNDGVESTRVCVQKFQSLKMLVTVFWQNIVSIGKKY